MIIKSMGFNSIVLALFALVTSLILATTNFTLLFGTMAPGGAYIVINPSLALGAPHTTFLISFSPTSTSQTFSRSAFGCFSVFKDRKTSKC